MERTVLRYAPSYWDADYEHNGQFALTSLTEEYKSIEYQVKQAARNSSLHIRLIERNQNIHDYGQVLVREQLMAVENSHENYYRVRRFFSIRSQYLRQALDYNLDHRRCGKSGLIFKKYLSSLSGDDVILVVQVITNTPNAESITPANSSEYFIDYVVHTV